MKTEINYERWCNLLCTLLDRIEIEEDHTLASQRHAIAEQMGLTVVFKEPCSGTLQ